MKAMHWVQDLHRPHLTACGLVGTTFYATEDRKLVDCKNCLRANRATILDNATRSDSFGGADGCDNSGGEGDS